ncbi:hypothetical protein [Microbacterium sp. zg.Y909]|uniref:hypothetical protein n=1 Tax=Microbacterium sp. zg.Y909 TaxID=2969413 RepID=UPI00214C0D96|nr:hypothetical protein [Microbacterium sp. zg.Y909]MCR2826730.1 hypothetical protein [Microbacterium sp. zg.Y909]
MTRYAIDAPTALRLIEEDAVLGAGHSLVAPSVLRTHALSLLYQQVRAGALDERVALARLERLAELKIRLLGDRVSRATAWKLATRLGWPDTPPAEYLAVAVLQADLLVTEDPHLRSGAEDRVALAPYEALLR